MIHRLDSSSSVNRPRPVGAPAPRPAPPRDGEAAPGDQFSRQQRDEPDDTPFWLVAMATDRMAARRYLDAKTTRRLAALEPAFVTELAGQAAPALTAWLEARDGAPRLADWQALVDAMCAAAALDEMPRVVHQPALREDRGQFLFQAAGSLIQLRPRATGDLADWVGTVAHETYHHLQHARLAALYRGEAPGPGLQAELAPYWRDARNVYQSRGPGLDAARHRRQALELGAWDFGGRMAKTVKGWQRLR